MDGGTKLVFSQETECEWEYEQVANGTTYIEHDSSTNECGTDVAYLVFKESRLNETPYLVNEIRECDDCSKRDGCVDVSHELTCHIDIDNLYVEFGIELDQAMTDFRKPSVDEEIACRGCKHEVVEDIWHSEESQNHDSRQNTSTAEN